MKPKCKFIASFVFILLFLSLLAIISADTGQAGSTETGISQSYESAAQIGNIIGPALNAGDIIVQGVSIEKPANSKKTDVSITKEGGYIKTKNGEFNNIQPETANNKASFVLDENGSVSYCNFYTNENGSVYTLGNYNIFAPPNSHIFYSNGKAEVTVPSGTNLEEEDLPRLISNPDVSIKNNIIEFGADRRSGSLGLPNGNMLQNGALVIDNGKTYIIQEHYVLPDTANIDNLRISGLQGSRERVFFDGLQHEDAGEDYLSFNADEKKMYVLSKDQNIYLKFEKGNPFIPIDDNQFFELRAQEKHDLELEITNPARKIPKLDVKALSGKSNICDGKFILYPSENNLGVTTTPSNYPGFNSDTAPMNLKFHDNNLLPAGKDLLINKDNSYTLIKENNPQFQQYVSLEYQNAPLTQSQIDLINKIKSENPTLTLKGNIPLSQLQELEDQLAIMTDPLKKATNTVDIVPTLSANVGGECTMDGKVRLPSNVISLNPEFISHEFAHNLDAAIRRDSTKQISSEERIVLFKKDFADQLNNILKNNGRTPFTLTLGSVDTKPNGEIRTTFIPSSSTKLPQNVWDEIQAKLAEYNNFHAIKASTFDKDWLNVQNGGYTYAPLVGSGSRSVSLWPDGTDSPKNGFVNAHGSTNMDEDKASFTEKFYRDPAFFEPLIDPASPQYDPRYMEKLTLLQENGFISEDQLNKLKSVAGTGDWSVISIGNAPPEVIDFSYF